MPLLGVGVQGEVGRACELVFACCVFISCATFEVRGVGRFYWHVKGELPSFRGENVRVSTFKHHIFLHISSQKEGCCPGLDRER